MLSLQELIERAARLYPGRLGIRCAGRERSWAELAERIARFATALQAIGVAEGDRVAILALNSDRYYESMFATVWAGACTVPLNTRWVLAENRYAIDDSEPRVLLFDEAFREQAEQLMAGCASLETAVYLGDASCPDWARSYEEHIAAHQRAAPSGRGGDAMAGIFYTGGTTGFPKGVMQSHRGLWASAIGGAQYFALTPESVYLHAAPMFHIADFAGTMAATLQGAGHVVLPAFQPEALLRCLAEDGVTHSLMVPSMIKMVLAHPDAAATDVSRLQRIIYGASPMPPATAEQCMSTWPSVSLVQAYGQTELAPIVTMLPPEEHRSGNPRLRSAGRPTPVSDVRIVAEDGTDCPPGESGEVVVRGPHAMLGYWNKPEETTAALRDGWVYTGDAGYLDEDGYLFIVDRVKDMIISGGENVYSTEVENALMSHAAVQDCAVIGIPHDTWGESVHAVVVLQAGKTVPEVELIEHCRGQIAGYKLPRSVEFRDRPLPLTGAGKVLKMELRRPWWKDREDDIS